MSRRLSLTMSEDDLRPHKRKPMEYTIPRTPPTKPSDLTEIAQKFEQREEKKNEIRRRLEENEKQRLEQQKAADLKLEVDNMFKEGNNVQALPDNNMNEHVETPQTVVPNLGRRYDNSRYFNWDDDDIPPIIGKEPVPPRTPQPTSSTPDFCKLCEMGRDKTTSTGHSKSSACAHVDHFLARLNLNDKH